MKNKIVVIVVVLSCSAILQAYMKFSFQKEFISTLLTVFAIFFGFYLTSFAVFATSKYMSCLYRIQDRNDNRKTLLDTLLGEFQFPTRFLLFSIVYLILLYVVMENGNVGLIKFSTMPVWGVLFLNIFYIFRAISAFIKVTRQSAKESE